MACIKVFVENETINLLFKSIVIDMSEFMYLNWKFKFATYEIADPGWIKKLNSQLI